MTNMFIDGDLLPATVIQGEFKRLQRVEECARIVSNSPAGKHYGFLPLLNALEDLDEFRTREFITRGGE